MAPAAVSAVPAVPGGMQGRVLDNRFAYIPAQCYAVTREAGPRAPVRNPCYVCHVHAPAPNFVDDGDLQLAFRLPEAAAANPWRNLFAPPILRAPATRDDEVLAYARTDNYHDGAGGIVLGARLAHLAPAWDGEGDGRWDGFVPDASFHFDERGYDRDPGGARTGWRAFAYAPLPGAFLPSNGSADDVLIRLPPILRQDEAGHASVTVEEINLAIVEALVTRADVAIDSTDEGPLGVDLDRDGRLGRASRVGFRARGDGTTPMQYVGRARGHERYDEAPIAPGLFPVGTEFLHSVRYLDVNPRGEVTMAARMKELRYARKARWLRPADLAARAAGETVEQNESPDGARTVLWQFDRGVYNGAGWLFQGFIEAADGSLRPQSYEESLPCAGCHGGLGATTDSVFAFARKLGGDTPARGWFHPTERALRGLPEPRRPDGEGEYARYLRANRAGDDFAENPELQRRFFDPAGALRPAALAALRADLGVLLWPSPARALALDRASWAVVREQSFTRGRDPVLASTLHAHRRVPADSGTGVATALAGPGPTTAIGAPARGPERPRPRASQ